MKKIFNKIVDSYKKLFVRNKKDWMFSDEFQKSVEEIMPEMKEQSFRIELDKNSKDSIMFSQLCLDVIDMWIDDLGTILPTDLQKVAIIVAHKSRRLLRASQLLLFSGYLPEAEIIHRSIIELTILVSYILNDETGKRAGKWLGFKIDQRWDFSMMSKEIMGDVAKDAYADLSSYCHPHVVGTAKYMRELDEGILRFERGAIKDFDLAEKQIFYISNSAVGIIEILNKVIKPSDRWVEKHNEIINSKIFCDNFAREIEPKIVAEDEQFMKIINNLGKYF